MSRPERTKKTTDKQQQDKPKKPKLDPYRRSKVRDNDRHGRYEDGDETF